MHDKERAAAGLFDVVTMRGDGEDVDQIFYSLLPAF
jgi:hypothetical protein